MYDEDKKFCMKCQQKLVEAKPSFNPFAKKLPPIFEFKDGWYCERCAKAKVESERAKK